MVENVFTPSEKYFPSSNISKSNPTPNYDAPGISFKGYSIDRSVDGFKTNIQNRVNEMYTTGVLSGTSVDYTISQPPKGKKLFIKKLILTLSIGTSSSASHCSILDKNGVVFKTGLLRSGVWIFDFEPTLMILDSYDPSITPSGARIQISSGGSGVINQCTWQILGWTE